MKALVRKRVFDNFQTFYPKDGLTIADVVNESFIPPDLHDYVHCSINGVKINRNMWERVRPNPGTTLAIQVIPRGGNFGQVFKVAAVLAVTIAVSYATSGLGMPLVSSALTAAAGIATSLVLNSVFPPPGAGSLPGLDYDSSNRKAINAVTSQSNRADPYGACIRAYGINRVYPRVAASPYTFFNNDDSYLVTIYDFGIGDIKIYEETLKIGETSLSNFDNVEYNIVNTAKGDEFTLYVDDVFSDPINVEYNSNGTSAIRTTQANTEFFQIDIVFPQGLAGINSNGSYVPNRVYFNLEFRETGTSEWKRYFETEYSLDPRFSTLSYEDESISIWDFSNESDTSVFDFGDFANLPYYYESNQLYIDAYRISNLRINYKSSKTKLNLEIGDQIIFRGKRHTVSSKDSVYCYLDTPIVYNAFIEEIDEVVQSSGQWNPLDDDTSITDTRLNNTLTVRRFFSDDIHISNDSIERFFTTVSIYPNEGPKQWDIRLTRTLSEENGRSGSNYNDATWSLIKSFRKTLPIQTKVPHTFLELRIKASEQLNGRVESLSAECISNLDVYNLNTGQWEKKETNNPAWIFADILTGDLNQRSISKELLDVESLSEWANYCNQNTISRNGKDFGFTCNFVLDSRTNVRELLNNICSTGRATIDNRNGRYGVIIDEQRTTPVQVFTPRNYSEFSSTRNYADQPHGIKCKYVDPFSNWQINEVIAYADGYNENNSSLFEELDLFGVTNEAQAWRQGRYFLAQSKLRQEQITIKVGIDHLACTRGDLVKLVSDVMKAGGVPSRVKSINGNQITLDDVVFDNGGTYQVEIRHLNGDISTYNVNSVVDTDVIEITDTSKCKAGDLVIFGEVEKVSIDCIVKSIIADMDLNATVVLKEYAPEIFDADTGTIPDYNPVIIDPDQTTGAKPGVVQDLDSSYKISCNPSEKRYRYEVRLSWSPPLSSIVENYEVYVTVLGQTVLAGITQAKEFVYFVENENLEKEHTFRVIGVSGTGAKLNLGDSAFLNFIPYQDRTAPGNVQNFYANILTERIELEWDLLRDCDLEKYIIKFYPETSGARWSYSQKVAEVSSQTSNKSVPLKTGTYLIKAVDWAGNYSLLDTRTITSIPENTAPKLIKEITGPNWIGTHENTAIRIDGGEETLILKGTNDLSSFNQNIGYFYFEEIFDLGDVYKARFESEIVAGGLSSDSIMANWERLSDIDILAGGDFDSSVKAEIQIRVKAEGDYMSDWASLSDVDFLAFGSEENSGPWKKLTVGDYTGRKFQVRIKLETNDLTQTPIVYSAKIKGTFPSRDAEGQDAVSGEFVYFDPGFVERPSLQLTTQENLVQGDYYEIIEKTGERFKIQFYDKNDNPVNDRQFDWKATGFGVKYFDNSLIYS